LYINLYNISRNVLLYWLPIIKCTKKDDNYPSASTNEVFYNTYLPAHVSKISTSLLTNRMLIIEKNKHLQEMENNMNMLNHNVF